MKPKTQDAATLELFQAHFSQILNPEHPLVRLANYGADSLTGATAGGGKASVRPTWTVAETSRPTNQA